MKISARNCLKGRVTEISKGAVNAVVKVDIGGGNHMTSIVTIEALGDLGLAVGQEAYVVVKASEVMLGVDH